MNMTVATIATTVHGRYLHEDRGPERLLVGFHGYAETADVSLAAMAEIPGIGEWSLLAIQALHPFYTKTGAVVASWMTSLDRELAMADNIDYIRRVIAAVPPAKTLVYLGFSQGASMAARAAAFATPAAGLILLGGDVPPDVKDDPAVKLPPVLVGRGKLDDWYSEEKFNKDLSFLQAKTRVTPCVFEGGHEWTDAFRTAASEFLRTL
jgi:predicted esterase